MESPRTCTSLTGLRRVLYHFEMQNFVQERKNLYFPVCTSSYSDTSLRVPRSSVSNLFHILSDTIDIYFQGWPNTVWGSVGWLTLRQTLNPNPKTMWEKVIVILSSDVMLVSKFYLLSPPGIRCCMSSSFEVLFTICCTKLVKNFIAENFVFCCSNTNIAMPLSKYAYR